MNHSRDAYFFSEQKALPNYLVTKDERLKFIHLFWVTIKNKYANKMSFLSDLSMIAFLGNYPISHFVVQPSLSCLHCFRFKMTLIMDSY